MFFVFFFNDTATTEIYTLSLHDALPILAGCIQRAQQIVESTPDAYMLQQFRNPANPDIHRRTTAEEIWQDTEGQEIGRAHV